MQTATTSTLATQCADTVLMVRPEAFDYNVQTAADNSFQNKPQQQQARKLALAEFDAMAEQLHLAGVQVLVHSGHITREPLPDAVFPNNWFITLHTGMLYTCPMLVPNRRAELKQLPRIERLLRDRGYVVAGIEHLGNDQAGMILEGTGSLVMDHVQRTLYAAVSARTNPNMVEQFALKAGYDSVVHFHARDSHGRLIYHTNVLLTLGHGVAVVCADAVADVQERRALHDALAAHHQVIEISMPQMQHHFCGNMLMLRTVHDQPIMVLSATALPGLTAAQRRALERHARLLPVSIPTIESIGGGSARCMLAEVFLPRR